MAYDTGWWSGKMSPVACSKMHYDTAINFEWKNVHFKFKQHRSHFEKGTYTRNDTGRINLRPLTTSNILCHWEYPATEPLWLPFLSQTSTGRVSVSKGTWHLVMVMTMPFNPVFCHVKLHIKHLINWSWSSCLASSPKWAKQGGGNGDWCWEWYLSISCFKLHTSCNDTTRAPTYSSIVMIIIVVTKLAGAQRHISEWWCSRRLS